MLTWWMRMIYAREQNYRRTRWQPNKNFRPLCSSESTQIGQLDAIGLSGTTNRWMMMNEKWMSLIYSVLSVFTIFKSCFLKCQLSTIDAPETYKQIYIYFPFQPVFFLLTAFRSCGMHAYHRRLPNVVFLEVHQENQRFEARTTFFIDVLPACDNHSIFGRMWRHIHCCGRPSYWFHGSMFYAIYVFWLLINNKKYQAREPGHSRLFYGREPRLLQ